MDELSNLLNSVGEQEWSDSIKKARSYLSATNHRGIEEAKMWFGTIGTLNDLVIQPANGHNVKAHELDEVNSKLRTLSSSTYHFAQDIVRKTGFE